MNRKWITYPLVLLLLFSLLLPVAFAAELIEIISDPAEFDVESLEPSEYDLESLEPSEIGIESLNPSEFGIESLNPAETGSESNVFDLIRDEAGLLTAEQAAELEKKAEQIEENYDCALYVATVDSMNGMYRRDFAKQYYIDHDLGYGSGKNGVLFLVCMSTREYVTVTYGKDPYDASQYGVGIVAFTDYGIGLMEDAVVSELSEGDYYEAFSDYLDHGEYYLSYLQRNGTPYDVQTNSNSWVRVLIVILVPLLIAGLVCAVFAGQMKTAVRASNADDFVKEDTVDIFVQQDQFTHTTETRRYIERSSSSGGGSSVDSDGFGGSSGGHF